MTAELIDGKAIAQALRRRIAERVRVLQERGVVPTLAVILVGEDPASHVYVRNKVTACAEVGIRSRKYEFPADVSAERLLACIDTTKVGS